MKVRRVNRYYCDFCRKAGCSRYHLARHEERCTLNPDRVCGMCKMQEHAQAAISELLATLPTPESLQIPTEQTAWVGLTFEDINGELSKAMPLLRAKAHNCPACILSALRQKKIPVPMVESFNYTEECKAVWDAINADRVEDYY